MIPIQVAAIEETYTDLAADSWRRRTGREALAEAFQECSAPDWDGYGASPADPLSASWACDVVAPLLPILGLPHYSFDPDGDVLLEWHLAEDRVLDLSVGANGEVRYSAVIGGSRMTGIEQFAEGLPLGLLSVARGLAQ